MDKLFFHVKVFFATLRDTFYFLKYRKKFEYLRQLRKDDFFQLKKFDDIINVFKSDALSKHYQPVPYIPHFLIVPGESKDTIDLVVNSEFLTMPSEDQEDVFYWISSYITLQRFEEHGDPVISNMTAAEKRYAADRMSAVAGRLEGLVTFLGDINMCILKSASNKKDHMRIVDGNLLRLEAIYDFIQKVLIEEQVLINDENGNIEGE